MRIGFVSHSALKHGAERALLELVDALRALGVKSYVVVPGPGPLIREFEARGVPVFVIPYEWWVVDASLSIRGRLRKLRSHVAASRVIAHRLRECDCDVVYTNTITVCVGAMAAKVLRRPHVWHIHEFGYEHHGLHFELGEGTALWTMNHLSTVCIANSRAVAEKYGRFIPRRKLKTVYQSVTIPSHFRGVEQQVAPRDGHPLRYVVVGNIQRGKRQEDAIRALAEMTRRGMQAELVIVGDDNPEYRKFLDVMIRQHDLTSLVKFTGYLDSPLPIVQTASALITCSTFESFGRVVVEAMLLGVPVVGANSGGTAEIIEDGVTGLLYEPGHYQQLAAKLQYLADNPAVARSLTNEARRSAREQFSQDRYGIEMLHILEEIVGRRG